MGKIVQLSNQLSNLIAAGEVVVNMASVVKELVENSIDASSSVITIDLMDAGLHEIKVTDNGVGMSQEDMFMSFKRHATSKIKTSHDLFHIQTLGFRGEAIPSIASVSEMEMISSEGQTGYRILLKNGQVLEQEEYAPRQGTTITVRYLFYNTPARLKHLKSTNTELSYIVDYINKMALSHPEISFVLSNDKKKLFASSGSNDHLKVLSNIYSLDIIKNMVPFEGENSYFKISGYITKPQFTRSSRNHITILANGRVIKNNALIKAVTEGYKTYIPIGKYPIVFLSVTLDPLLIDVNVHPQKLEVKFTEQRMLVSLISKTIHAHIRRLNLIPEIKQAKPQEEYKYQSLNLRSQEAEPTLVKEDFTRFMADKVKQRETEESIAPPIMETKRVEPGLKKVPNMEYIGTYMGTYLLCQDTEGLYIIDQHAAAERIRYEDYKKRFGQVEIQTTELLIPITLDLSSQEVLQVKDRLDELQPLGVVAKDNGHMGIDISHVPSYFPKNMERIYVETMIQSLLENKDLSVENTRDGLAKNLSCKHSIKANHYISRNEIDRLLYDLEQCENPYTCPHGRPVIIKFTVSEIEKLFKRIQ
jgi:DNA mismatch repair protein MutL